MSKTPKTKSAPKNKKRSPHVPGQALGYSLQTTQFVSLLLQAPTDSKVSLEVFEDIGIELANKTKKAVQSKSTFDGNPVSDRAVDLWKTFYNWTIAAEAGELDPETTIFEIYVSRKVGGEIVESFSNAKNAEEAEIAFNNARKKLWGNPPKYVEKETVAKSISNYLEYIFNSNKAVICKIICAFSLVTGSGSPQKDLAELFAKGLTPDDLIDDIHDYALGWVKKKIDIASEQKKPATIEVNEFRTKMQSFIRKHDSRTILRSFAKDPKPEEIRAETLKKYVRQLELIKAADNIKLRAVTDYLKASIDRTEWSKKGLVFETSFTEFEDNLVRAWENLKIKTFLGNKDKTEEEKGNLLYCECSLHRANLQNMEAPAHFVPGSFNALADIELIGWHPDFLTILKYINFDDKEEDGA